MRLVIPMPSYQPEANAELERQVLVRLTWLGFPAYEQAIKLLLEGMGYVRVEIIGRKTWHGPSDWGGVDIRAEIVKGGIRSQTFVQVKQEQSRLQRRYVDELRGAMDRLGAPQGLIFTLCQLSVKAVDAAALYPGRPISLINGQRLARLMVKHLLGVRLSPLSDRTYPELVLDELFFDQLEERS